MGKVMINEADATKTARNGSSADGQRGTHPRERAHLDLSRKSVKAEDIEKKVNTKAKAAVKVAAGGTTKSQNQATGKVAKEAEVKKIAVKSENNTTKAVARTVKPGSKTPRITKYAKKETAVQIIARETPKQLGSGARSVKPEVGLAVRKRNIDPELALMASRAQSMEKAKINSRSNSANNGRSMSGMVGARQTNAVRNSNLHTSNNSSNTAKAPVEETAGFTKAKSALIGVGVAVVVAVVGFAGIAIFGSNKNMCTVAFESNGGSVVEGTEFVCGRTITKPEDPTKDGFVFEGWIYEGDPFDFGTEIYKNATLVAKWRAEDGVEVVTVKFDTDGGSVIKDIDLAKGRKLTPPSAPTKIGYVFEDWYLGDEPFDFDQPIEENITLKAKWERREGAGGDNSTAKPNNRVTSLTASKTSITLDIGKSEAITINVLPSSADYSLAAVSSNSDIVECSVNKTTVTCMAKAGGTASVKVRDVNSGNMTSISVSVRADDVPPVTDPNPEEPPKEEPEPEPQPDPQPVYYTFTIYYKYADGTEARAPQVVTLKQGESYNEKVPTIEGYTASHNAVGTDPGGIQGNIEATITYTPIATPDPEPTDPSTGSGE